MNQNQKEVLAGIKAQADFSLQYVKDIVNNLVKDTALATQVNDAVTTKLNSQRDAFVRAIQAEDDEVELTSEQS